MDKPIRAILTKHDDLPILTLGYFKLRYNAIIF